MWLWAALFGAVAAGASYLERRAHVRRTALAVFRAAARRHGFEATQPQHSPAQLGERDGLRLEAELRPRRRAGERHTTTDGARARLVLRGQGRIDRSLVIAPEGALEALRRAVQTTDAHATGDPALDAAVVVRGDPVLVAGLLTPKTRHLLLRVVGTLGLRVREGDVVLEADELHLDRARTEHLIGRMLELAEALGRPLVDPVAALAERVRSDPLPPVQLRCLALAARVAPEHGALRSAAETLLDHPEPTLRCAAAMVAGPGGLGALASLARDVSAPEPLRAAAVRQLALRHPEPGPLLLALLDAAAGPIRRLAIEGLGRRRAREAVEALCALVERGAPEEAAGAVEALRYIGDARATPVLLEALESGATPRATRLASARALGSLGGRASAQALTRIVEDVRSEAELREVARAAREWIQRRERTRIGDDPRGGLSLVLAADAPGALALSDPLEGTLGEPRASEPAAEGALALLPSDRTDPA